MEFRPLEVTVNSAENLKNLRHVSTMDVYVVVSLSGDERYKTKQQTPVHEDGGTNPRWGHAFSFTVDVVAARAGRLSLEFEIKDEHALRGHMDVGRVDVPVKELLEQSGGAGAGEPKLMRYSVRLPSGETKGVLEFSYKFGEFTVATPPEARNESVIADPAAAALSSTSSAAGCPPNAGPSYPAAAAPSYSSSAAGCPPNAGPSYPPQGYGYPPPGYQSPPAVSLTGAQIHINMMMDDCSHEARYDAESYDCFNE